MGVSDKRDSDKREHIRKNGEVKVSDAIEDLRVEKLSFHKHLYNVETKSDIRNHVDMNDDKESTERDEISKNDEETLTSIDKEYE